MNQFDKIANELFGRPYARLTGWEKLRVCEQILDNNPHLLENVEMLKKIKP